MLWFGRILAHRLGVLAVTYSAWVSVLARGWSAVVCSARRLAGSGVRRGIQCCTGLVWAGLTRRDTCYTALIKRRKD